VVWRSVAGLGQVLVWQQVRRQRGGVELEVKAARPRAGEQHVDAAEARAARRRAQLADGRRVDAAAAAAAREVRDAQPRQLGDAGAAEVEKSCGASSPPGPAASSAGSGSPGRDASTYVGSGTAASPDR